MTELDERRFLASTYFIDHTHPAVSDFAHTVAGAASTPRERAVRLFIEVRDRVRYDPYTVQPVREGFKASSVLATGRAFCTPKAILLAAAARALGIPSRLGFADVTNHLSSQRLLEMMGTTVFAFHGYTELWLEGRWLKATPAFNAQLCEKLGVAPLEFDGTRDAVLQSLNSDGSRFMEYLRDRGTYDDLPLDEMLRVFRELYPQVMAMWEAEDVMVGDFEAEARAAPDDDPGSL